MQFKRLESLLEQAVRSPAKKPPVVVPVTNAQAAAPAPAAPSTAAAASPATLQGTVRPVHHHGVDPPNPSPVLSRVVVERHCNMLAGIWADVSGKNAGSAIYKFPYRNMLVIRSGLALPLWSLP